jgi:CheY-like chemotaxis protein
MALSHGARINGAYIHGPKSSACGRRPHTPGGQTSQTEGQISMIKFSLARKPDQWHNLENFLEYPVPHMPPTAPVLIIDDDPVHLQIYRFIVESVGFRGLPVQVTVRGLKFPDHEPVDAVLLDYRVAPNISARSVALEARQRYPSAPIVVLSDIHEIPDEMAAIVQGFVRNGNPEKLLETLRYLVAQPL